MTIGPVSIGIEVQRNTDGDTPSRPSSPGLKNGPKRPGRGVPGRNGFGPVCRFTETDRTDRNGPERTGTDRNGLSWIPKRTL